MRRGIFLLSLLGAFVGSLQFLYTLSKAESAPQQAAGAAMSAACAMLPYVFARSVAEMSVPADGPVPADVPVPVAPTALPPDHHPHLHSVSSAHRIAIAAGIVGIVLFMAYFARAIEALAQVSGVLTR